MARNMAILPDSRIRAMVDDGTIRTDMGNSGGGNLAARVQPASLDLAFGRRAWRVRASFLPGKGTRVEDRLETFAMHEIDLAAGAALETGCVYLVALADSLALPDNVSAVANAKSSAGRLDLFVRLIADGATRFDRVPGGYKGPLYAEISPRTFSVLARAGSSVIQIRFLSDGAVSAGGTAKRDLPFSVDLAPENGMPAGWRARRHSALIDLDRTACYDVADFWDPVYPCPRTQRGIILDPDAFYILCSREAVMIPPDQAAEMLPFIATIGEFRVHYAGFFDPGFGDGDAQGARAVLEVRCRETPFALEHGQVVGLLHYEPMLHPPERLYGEAIGSHYQAQRLQLSRHFRPPGSPFLPVAPPLSAALLP